MDKGNNIKLSIFKRLLKNLYPVFMIFSAFMIIIIISLIIYSKTQHFQNLANSIINRSLQSILQPGTKFNFKSVSLSYLFGLKIDEFQLINNNRVVFYSKEIHAGIKILPLLRNKIVVNEFLIDKPKIYLFKSSIDSIWNVERLFLPSSDTTPSEPSEIKIDINRVRLIDGRISVYDSTMLMNKNEKFDYYHFTLKDFNLNLSSKIDLKNNRYNFNVNKLSFSESNSHFILNSLKFIAEIDSNKINIKNLSIKSEKSELELKASVNNFNIFNENSSLNLAKVVFEFNFNSKDLSEISKFIPDINLFGEARFVINGNSKYNTLNLHTKDMWLNNSKLNFQVNVKEFLSDDPKLTVVTYDTRINEKDFRSILADFKDIDLPNFDFVYIKSSVFSYEKEVINAKFDILSPIANAEGDLNLNLNNNYSYLTNFKVNNLNLAPILKDPELNSNINAFFTLEGEGNKIENLKFKLNLFSENSVIKNFQFKDIRAKIFVNEASVINIDTFNFRFLNIKSTIDNNKNYLSLRGKIDFRKISFPIYDLHLSIDELSLFKILSDSLLPETITTDLRIKGKGIEPDDINVDITADHFDWKYNGMSMPDLAFNLQMDSLGYDKKIIKFNSKPLNFELKGKYHLLNLSTIVQNTINIISKQINKKINLITLKNDSLDLLEIPPFKFIDDSIDINFDVFFRDSILVKKFLNFIKCNVDINLSLNLKNKSNKTIFDLKKFTINEFELIDGKDRILTDDAIIRAVFTIDYNEKINLLDSFKTIFSFPKGIRVSDFYINSSNSLVEYYNDSIFIRTNTQFLDNFDFLSNISIAFLDEIINVNYTEFHMNYYDLLKIKNNGNIKISINPNEIKIDKFLLSSNIFSSLEVSGIVRQNSFDNFNVMLKDIQLKEIYTFIRNIDREYSELLTGKLDSIEITLNNTFENTFINTAMAISGITVEGNKLGKIYSELQHKDTTITGFINAFIENGNKVNNIFTLNISKIPLNLSLNNQSERFNENAQIGFSLNSNDFPLDYIAPFVKGVKNLKGFADISLKVTGNNLNSIDYNGHVILKKMSYLLDFNNMKYYTNAKINIKKDSILIENLTLSNDYYDLKNGVLNTYGFVCFDKFNVKNFDIKLQSKRLKILSNASMKSMPSLYGDFVIALDPIRIYGTTAEPFVEGQVNILAASLNMPSSNTKEVSKSKLIYRYKDNKSVDFEIVKDVLNEEVQNENIVQKKSSDYTNPVNINIGIKFLGKFITTMEIAGLGQLFAEIGTNNPEEVVRFVLNKNSEQPSIYGADILVKENSTLKLIKAFNTRGTISFPKGIVDNPSLNLLATYNGQRITSEQISYYTVNMHIRGTKNEPLVSFSYSIDGQEGQGDSSKINEDAILLLTLGKIKSELNPSNMTSGNSDFIGSTASSVASTMASSALTDFVQATGFIQSADIDIGNNVTNFDQARMKLSGEIKGIRWTLGGTVADFANNNEISIDVPLAVDLGIDWMNHFILQLTKASNTNQVSTTRSQKDWEIKLKLGGSW